MASPYSITVILGWDSVFEPWVAHGLDIINTPYDQTYAGFGPVWHSAYAPGQYDVQIVAPGQYTVPGDFSSVNIHDERASFTIPLTESQATIGQLSQYELFQTYLNQQINRTWGVINPDFPLDNDAPNPAYDGPVYNGVSTVIGSPNVCTTCAGQTLQITLGMPYNPLYTIPKASADFLAAVSNTLAVSPDADFTSADQVRASQIYIAPQLRGLQQDYFRAGSGFDTPSERLGDHGPSLSVGEQSYPWTDPGFAPGSPWPDAMKYPAVPYVGPTSPENAVGAGWLDSDVRLYVPPGQIGDGNGVGNWWDTVGANTFDTTAPVTVGDVGNF